MKLLIVTSNPTNPPLRVQLYKQAALDAGWDVEVVRPEACRIPSTPPLIYFDEATEITTNMFGDSHE